MPRRAVSYEFVRRRGSDYRPTAYGEAFSPVLVAMPTAAGTNVNSWIRGNSGFRTWTWPTAISTWLNGRIDFALKQNMDAGISLQLRDPTIRIRLTVKHQTQHSPNLDLNYQPSPRQTSTRSIRRRRGRRAGFDRTGKCERHYWPGERAWHDHTGQCHRDRIRSRRARCFH